MEFKLSMPETIIFHRILDRIVADGVFTDGGKRSTDCRGMTTHLSIEEVRLAEKLLRELLKV